MSEREERFQPEEKVILKNSSYSSLIEEPGPGPLTVHTVTEVSPVKCTCGGSIFDKDHKRYGGCPYNSLLSDIRYRPLRDLVGHSQFLTIKDANGNVLSRNGAPREFSGFYFKKV